MQSDEQKKTYMHKDKFHRSKKKAVKIEKRKKIRKKKQRSFVH